MNIFLNTLDSNNKQIAIINSVIALYKFNIFSKVKSSSRLTLIFVYL